MIVVHGFHRFRSHLLSVLRKHSVQGECKAVADLGGNTTYSENVTSDCILIDRK